MKMSILFLGLLLLNCTCISQSSLGVIDVKDYEIFLRVSDSSDRIEVDEWVRFRWLDTTKPVVLDLVEQDVIGKGMKVDHVIVSGDTLSFEHRNGKLIIQMPYSTNEIEDEMMLHFSGIPADGLIISKNKFGDRTFFGDNWPDRAHNWFACVDHPSDKATVGFQVLAPEKYDVVAVGKLLQDEERGEDHYCFYRSNVPLPTKVMVVGIADLMFDHLYSGSGIPVVNAIYKGENEEVQKDMTAAVQILDYFEKYIAPYEYEELENVQSTTRYGGMENAGCIFYDENAFNGRVTGEDLLAHEIAHQWFGNSASESDWQHVWLSEGFATYFTNLYIRSGYGEKAFDAQLQKDRKLVLKFYDYYPHPIVDTTYPKLENLLNANSYQKGSWVLHMLHHYLGDTVFRDCIRSYYEHYRLSNASTKDLQQDFERVSGQDLDWFFDQWLYNEGHPVLSVGIKRSGGRSILFIDQTQSGRSFIFPLRIRFVLKNGEDIVKDFQINEREQEFVLDIKGKITGFEADPETDLLFELKK